MYDSYCTIINSIVFFFGSLFTWTFRDSTVLLYYYRCCYFAIPLLLSLIVLFIIVIVTAATRRRTVSLIDNCLLKKYKHIILFVFLSIDRMYLYIVLNEVFFLLL